MSIRDEITGYIDGNGLVMSSPANPGTLRGSDNGLLYTSEYYLILAKSNQLTEYDRHRFDILVTQCQSPNGMLNRVPLDQFDGQEACDDYYGVLSACLALKNTAIPRSILKATIHYMGFLNNVTPGNLRPTSFLPREPAFIASLFSASFPSAWNPLHIFARFSAFPAYFITSLVIATSCMFTPTDDSDSRLLSWHVIQATKSTSLLCKLASLLWCHRLYKQYGPDGMKAVARIYFYPHDSHPFTKYWID